MADKARKWTDKQLERMERKISRTYKQAEKDLTKKWNAYMRKDNEKIKGLKAAYDEAKAHGTVEQFEAANKEYTTALKAYTLQNDHYKAMVDSVTKDMAEVNQMALSYTNSQLTDIYAGSYEKAMSSVKGLGSSFELADKRTVMRMIKEGDIKTPFMKKEKHLNIPKDQRWNTKKINSSVLQGILQGESIDTISKRIFPIVNSNKAAAIRNARTLVNGAENAGRLDSYKNLEEQGAVLKKVWIATNDDRTRDWHLDLDGQEVDLDEMFVDGNGNELEYPADPNAEAETVYNCRCAMEVHVLGFKDDEGNINYVDESLHEDSGHHEQIEEEIERREGSEDGFVNGTDISDTWERRPDEFDFEIDDVINAQGYDGLPKVVDPDEFDRYVAEANDGNGFIAQRTYSAADQETLDLYRNELYDGKFYVDCSTGGAQYGQGMYCAADYTGTLTEGIKEEMAHYKELGNKRFGAEAFSYTETFTLDKSAKIISYDDLHRIKYNAYDYYVENEIKKLAKMGYSDESLFYIADRIGVDRDYGIKDRAMKWFNTKKDEVARTDALIKDIKSRAYDYNLKIRSKTDDMGSLAALLGYDAINAVGHGASGSYTVILNRTKLIIRRSR